MNKPPAATTRAASNKTSQKIALPKPSHPASDTVTYAPIMVNDPWAKLITRRAPKTSVRPAETRKSTEPVPNPAMICTT